MSKTVITIATTITMIDEQEEVTHKKATKKIADKKPSLYSRWFNESNINWRRSSEYNMMFLRTNEKYVNDLLKSRNHVFLNEIYVLLGFARTTAGATTGWIKNAANSDGFIDFGISDAINQDFVNGLDNKVLLDFNVDGIIYDLIGEKNGRRESSDRDQA